MGALEPAASRGQCQGLGYPEREEEGPLSYLLGHCLAAQPNSLGSRVRAWLHQSVLKNT